MAAPVLTPQEEAQITAEKAKVQGQIDALNSAIPAAEARIDELEIVDGSFKKFFDYYNEDIVGAYDAELRALNGDYNEDPIVEQDILDAAQGTGRLAPSLPDTDLVRIDEFDNLNQANDPENELNQFDEQDTLINLLTNGSGAGGATVNPLTTLTTTEILTDSTTVSIEDASTPIMFAAGNKLIIGEAIIEITTATEVSAVAPFSWDLEFTFILNGAAAIGSEVETDFLGFSNGERASKTGTPQDIMDNLVATLQGSLNFRLAALTAQQAAINLNDDADHEPKAPLLTNITTSINFINNYLLTTDISDTGIASLNSERDTRKPQAQARVPIIQNAYTGNTNNYYDLRYGFANDRGNTQRGTLRQKQFEEDNKNNIDGIIVDLQAQLDAYNNLVP